jgi:hypothetical protein
MKKKNVMVTEAQLKKVISTLVTEQTVEKKKKVVKKKS